MTLQSILNSPPKVHNWGAGKLTSSGLPFEVFEFMHKTLTPKSKSVETGMGISTAVFALSKGRHTCINPDEDEMERFAQYACENNLNIENVTFLCKKSHEAWFELKDKAWDFILIDGLHGFPTPFMDWYFLSQGLALNGYLIIDDTHIATGRILKDFLLKEDAWRSISPYSGKTAIFQKIKPFDYNKEFKDQPYILGQTKKINAFKNIRRYPVRLMRRLWN